MGRLIVADALSGRIRLKAHIILVAQDDGIAISDDQHNLVLPGHVDALPFFERLIHGIEAEALAGDPATALFSPVLREMMSLGWITRREIPQFPDGSVAAPSLGIFDAWCDDEWSAPGKWLTGSHVAVVGLGGIGSEMALHLAAAGVGGLTLIDGDNVELSNLNRQYAYSRRDLGRPKHEVLIARLRDLRPDIVLQGHGVPVRQPDDLALLNGAHLVIQAADDLMFPLDAWAATWSEANNTGFMTASVGVDVGYWGPLAIPKRTPPPTLLLERLAHRDGNDQAIRQNTPWSLGATNSLVAAFAARDVIAVLAGAHDAPSLGRRMRIQFSTGAVGSLDLRG